MATNTQENTAGPVWTPPPGSTVVPNLWSTFVATALGKSYSDIFTQADFDKLLQTYGASVNNVKPWIGGPIIYVNTVTNDLSIQDRLLNTIARITQKGLGENFTQADLVKIQQAKHLTNAQAATLNPLVGHPISEAAQRFGSQVVDTILGLLESGGGILPTPNNPLDFLANFGNMLSFITNPQNWLYILGGFAGVILVIIGGRKVMDNTP